MSAEWEHVEADQNRPHRTGVNTSHNDQTQAKTVVPKTEFQCTSFPLLEHFGGRVITNNYVRLGNSVQCP
jgi:hypothetical protein